MGARPSVVFLDSSSWQGFLDLAGALREAEISVLHVGTRSASRRTRLMQALEATLLGRPRRAVTGGASTGRPASISAADLMRCVPPGAADVQMQDDLMLCALAVTGGPADPRRMVADGVDPRVLVDKSVQEQWARMAGVPTPRAWSSPVSTEFPVVVKARTGSGGRGVRVVHSPDELLGAWDALTGPSGELPFVQQFLTQSVSTGGVAQDGELILCVPYRGRPAQGDPTGPFETVTAVEDPRAVELTARFLDLLGYSGFFCLDWVVDDEGALLLIDFNARVFGSWVALQAQGFDFISAYLYTLGAGPRPVAAPPRRGREERILRYPCPSVGSPRDVHRWRADSLDVVRDRRPWLGRRWSGVMRTRTEIGALRALPRAVRGLLATSDDVAQRAAPPVLDESAR